MATNHMQIGSTIIIHDHTFLNNRGLVQQAFETECRRILFSELPVAEKKWNYPDWEEYHKQYSSFYL